MIIKTKWDNQNHLAIEEKTTLVTPMAITKTSLRPLEKIKKADTNKNVCSSNHFEILQDDLEENDYDLNNYPINGNFDPNKDNEKQCPTKMQKQNLLWQLF